jgi:hypothetical protein
MGLTALLILDLFIHVLTTGVVLVIVYMVNGIRKVLTVTEATE